MSLAVFGKAGGCDPKIEMIVVTGAGRTDPVLAPVQGYPRSIGIRGVTGDMTVQDVSVFALLQRILCHFRRPRAPHAAWHTVRRSRT
jgi:hypothetical protein